MLPQKLRHITLATGHVRTSSRDKVAETVLTALAPLSRSNQLTIGGFEVAIIKKWRAVVLVGIAQEKQVLVENVICWNAVSSEAAWSLAVSRHRTVARILPASLQVPADIRMPVQPPWMATVILPNILLAQPSSIAALGNLEPCVAWSLIEHLKDVTEHLGDTKPARDLAITAILSKPS